MAQAKSTTQTKATSTTQAPGSKLALEHNGVKVTQAQADKMANMNTSERIRFLSGQDFTRSQIAKYLDKRYQHVRNVLITPLKKQTDEAQAES